MREMDIRVDGYSDAVWSIFGRSRMRGRFARSSKLVRFPSALPPSPSPAVPFRPIPLARNELMLNADIAESRADFRLNARTRG